VVKTDPYGGVPLGVEAIPSVMVIELRRGEFLRLTQLAGSTLTAHLGSVWVTEEESPRDVLLRAGQSFKLRRPGLAVVEAFSDASISVSN
jgi:hypothetical protein